jgi:hypothetical protein
LRRSSPNCSPRRATAARSEPVVRLVDRQVQRHPGSSRRRWRIRGWPRRHPTPK